MGNNDILFIDKSASIYQPKVADQENYLNYSTNSVYLKNKYMLQLREYFEALKMLWLEESKFCSLTFFNTQHPAYIKIIELGETVIPFILEDLDDNNNHWFYALSDITGYNPIQDEHAGNISEMVKDWMEWGRKMNYVQ